MKLNVCILLLLSYVSAQSYNETVNDLNADYLQDVFLEKVSNIPDIPVLNSCQMQLIYMARNWKKLSIFPSKLDFFL